ncbi:MAG TPA: hypothetical protein VMU51_17655 [Mycobacteriales bacterium]|nr:hypothetical protein [Mycobacteriales bacterium]
MPRGSYLHLDGHGGGPVAVEEFSCAAGPAGWRYASVLRDPSGGAELGRVDVTLDGGGRQVRVELLAGGWRLRGGVAGPQTVWLRSAVDGGEPAEQATTASGLTGRSPAFLIATARRLRLTPGGRARTRLVLITEPALGVLEVDENWSLLGISTHSTDTGPLPVARYDVTDLATGDTRAVHLAGDVVVATPTIELTELHTPPSL